MVENLFFDGPSSSCINVILVDHNHFEQLQSKISETQWYYVQSLSFKGNAKEFILLPNDSGHLKTVLWGVEGLSQIELLGYLRRLLPQGNYHIDDVFGLISSFELAYLGYALGSYQYNEYKQNTKVKEVKLAWPDNFDKNIVKQAQAIYLVRDLINTPANDLGPEELSDVAESIAKEYKARFQSIVGDALLEQNYPLIHAVGRASKRLPRLIKINWGNPDNPHIALVGKGVCYDTGGLSLKTNAGMKLMKKDMGGAAQTLGLMQLIMAYQLPVYLTVLIPAVENSIGGDAYRLGDIITARNGKTVEILNTDAEGRLILADALSEASESNAELIIDFATLTGAARVALGMDIGAIYSNDDVIAKGIESRSEIVEDLLWHMPLFAQYKKGLKGSFSDLTNVANSPYAGSIVAALFLEEFVDDKSWVHFDMSGWRNTEQAISKIGGDAMGLRAVFDYLCSRYS